MGDQIRQLMAKADGFEKMKGHVEIDEAYIGGYRPARYNVRSHGKTIVVGIVERGGRTVAKAVPNLRKETIRPFIYENVACGAAVSTDEAQIYELLKRKVYDHKAVNHSEEQWRTFNYRRGEWHHTNSIVSFWKIFKNSIKSTYIHVSAKYMDHYLNEFAFRSNHRHMTNAMFDLLIAAV